MLAVLLAGLHAILAVTATAEKSMTSDEIAHLTAGQSYNMRGDYRLQPENGNLPQRLAALPMTLARVPLPPTSLESWGKADVWNYGHAFFYEQGIAADQWLFLGRAMIALISAATGLLVFAWSRALFGWRGGFLSLVFFTFSPTLLAHGALTTSDVAMTFFFLASVGAFWRHLEHPGLGGAVLSCCVLGLAFVAKFSAVFLPPMLALIGLAWMATRASQDGWRSPGLRLLRSTVGHAVAVWAIIWAFYGFRFSAFAPELAEHAMFSPHGWEWILNDVGRLGRVIVWLRDRHVLPEAWVYGLTFVLQFSRARGAFMSGELGLTGWVTFFPFTLLIKSTLPLLLLCGAGLVAATAALGRRIAANAGRSALARLRPLTPLAVLFVVYWVTSLTSHLNIGHRHILPTYPVMFIGIGWLARWLDWRRPIAVAAIAVLILWHVCESQRIRPHYLAYFNEIIGGPANGWHHLVDSSLDWGQDLPGLKTWLDAHARGEKVFLSYFGTGDPAYEGIDAAKLPTLPEVGTPKKWQPLAPGIYAVSATMLQHVYSKVRGEWTPALEREFQQLRAIEPTLLAYQNDPAQRVALLREAPDENWQTAWKRYEQLRFARLCHYLRVRTPDANIGYSILVYRLNADEIRAATGNSLHAWQMLIEKAVLSRDGGNRF